MKGYVIYRFSISGSSVRVLGSVDLERVARKVAVANFAIANSRVVATFNRHFAEWPYPSGGRTTKLRDLPSLYGVAISY
jgi:hypothetical protein